MNNKKSPRTIILTCGCRNKLSVNLSNNSLNNTLQWSISQKKSPPVKCKKALVKTATCDESSYANKRL